MSKTDQNQSGNKANEKTNFSAKSPEDWVSLAGFVVESVRDFFNQKNTSASDAAAAKSAARTEAARIAASRYEQATNYRTRKHKQNLIYQGFITVACLITVVLLGKCCIIDNCTTGTLIGTIIGYTLGQVID
ncbi:hypothetical protein SAMN05421780_11124 [Flexibacter flexilis DSM 6793]|uniref:Uncharacterized protein n=1 Tax=Flexibacter flexilis DSM 6793 TaxID=927664 RepID=A0A1I1MNJ3_9BACT|nr:hypothetical protein [Flexibacter flexilis]SFC87057.1 hypothetical protein SAMN05421780_11124 [Flexibacter flexilis DSM 6793]